MPTERKLKVRPVPPTNKGGPFRAFVSTQILELFGGKSETAVWILDKIPVPVTLWREQPPTKGGKQEPLGSNVIQLSETVRQMGRLNLEDTIIVLRDESAWVPNAGSILLEETFSNSNSRLHLDGMDESEAERQQRQSKDREDRITRKSLEEPALQALLRHEVVLCGQQLEVMAQGTSTKTVLTVRKVDGSQAGGLHWMTDETHIEIVKQHKYEMKIPRDRIGGLTAAVDRLDDVLDDYAHAQWTYPGTGELFSNFLLLTGPAGCGKTTLMEVVARLAWPKVFRLSTDAKSTTKIHSVVNSARRFPRALILIDDISELVKDDKGQMNVFAKELLQSMLEIRKDKHLRIMIIAATRDPLEIPARLREADGFDFIVRCGLPNAQARKDILKLKLGHYGVPEDALVEIGRQTHAFSGKDLVKLALRLLKSKAKASGSRAPSAASFGRLSDKPSSHSMNEWLVYADQALKEVKPTTMEGLSIEVPSTRFSDIGGQHALKARLENQLRKPTLDAEVYKLYGIKPLKGLLMYGPPGNSKTLMARALATEFRFNFLLVNASQLISSYVGESEKRLRELFQQARDAAPCILFFDEFETIGAARGGRDTHSGLNIVQTMLTEMDGVQPLEGVFVLAATNRPDSLDPALLRPGRLHPHVLIGLPDKEARREIMRISLRRLPQTLRSEDLNEAKFEELSARTEGFTGAQMARLMEEAIEQAAIGTSNSTKYEDARQLVSAKHVEAVLKTMEITVTEEEIRRYEEWSA